MSFYAKLNQVQTKLNAPKDAYNSFGKYKYRSAESILQAVKPLLAETGLVLTIADSIEVHGGRTYIKATATVTDGEHSIHCTALAREPHDKKGMDDSQITGAASSYARKYALCGLFAIDDNKDADATNTHGQESKGINMPDTVRALKEAQSLENLQAIFKEAWTAAAKEQRPQIKDTYDKRKADFEAAQETAS
ncbi:hypothetical protein L1281_002522 [Neisseria sp. HSC-16F19]|nr:ERF family protein [Neisseria sp. HSC-16F19]MCP2041904.1 hypothetical protein [Neisseria sp. HSC-16F19]